MTSLEDEISFLLAELRLKMNIKKWVAWVHKGACFQLSELLFIANLLPETSIRLDCRMLSTRWTRKFPSDTFEQFTSFSGIYWHTSYLQLWHETPQCHLNKDSTTFGRFLRPEHDTWSATFFDPTAASKTLITPVKSARTKIFTRD